MVKQCTKPDVYSGLFSNIIFTVSLYKNSINQIFTFVSNLFLLNHKYCDSQVLRRHFLRSHRLVAQVIFERRLLKSH